MFLSLSARRGFWASAVPRRSKAVARGFFKFAGVVVIALALFNMETALRWRGIRLRERLRRHEALAVLNIEMETVCRYFAWSKRARLCAQQAHVSVACP